MKEKDVWFRRLGFYNNPFSIKPASFNDELFGYSLEEVNGKIVQGKILFIQGEFGKGKTTILKKLIRDFGGRKKLVYYSCNRTEDNVDFEALLKGRSFWNRLFNTLPKDMILLLDEAQDLSTEDSDEMLKYYQKNFRAIVLVASDYKKTCFSKAVQEFLEGNIIRLDELTEDDAVNIIRKRIGNIDIISDDMIKLVFKKPNKNPRQLLKNCEEVCRLAMSKGDEQVTAEHVREGL